MTAASSGATSRTVRPSVAVAAAAASGRRLRRTRRRGRCASERFIARHMRSVSRVPEAPTSVPGDDERAVAEREAASIAAARPVYALRSEMTTGMSAPPIGSTSATPNSERSSDERRSDHRASPCLGGRRERPREARAAAASTQPLTTAGPGT